MVVSSILYNCLRISLISEKFPCFFFFHTLNPASHLSPLSCGIRRFFFLGQRSEIFDSLLVAFSIVWCFVSKIEGQCPLLLALHDILLNIVTLQLSQQNTAVMCQEMPSISPMADAVFLVTDLFTAGIPGRFQWMTAICGQLIFPNFGQLQR